MIANYRVQAELSAIDSTHDGKSIVLGTVDGCVSVLAIADPKKSEMKEYLANVPSRDEEVSKKIDSKDIDVLNYAFCIITWTIKFYVQSLFMHNAFSMLLTLTSFCCFLSPLFTINNTYL